MSAKLNSLIEKLFILLLTGAGGFAVSYLRDISQGLDAIKDRVGVACEQISAIDEGIKHLSDRIAINEEELKDQKKLFDELHPRKG